jgi:hypothetical protein
MNRKSFLKSLLILPVIPFIPKAIPNNNYIDSGWRITSYKGTSCGISEQRYSDSGWIKRSDWSVNKLPFKIKKTTSCGPSSPFCITPDIDILELTKALNAARGVKLK